MRSIVAALIVATGIAPGTCATAFAATTDRKPVAVPAARPLLKASLRPNISPNDRPALSRGAQADARSDRSWVERHPVWTGAIAGFAAGFGGTYLLTDEGGIPGRGAAAIVYGCVGAGIGALVGWSIGRNRNDDYSASRR